MAAMVYVQEVRTVAAECGANAIAVQGDVTLREHHTEVLQAALKRFGHVVGYVLCAYIICTSTDRAAAQDVWVNNAGQGMSRFVEDLTDDDLDTMILVNVKSALYGMQTVLPHFKERRCGHIINVSSLLGRMPLASVRAAYSASKHALNALTASLRMDIAAQGFDRIIVSTVTPGPVATEFGVNAVYGGMDNRTIPGSQDPHEVAQVIAETMEVRRTPYMIHACTRISRQAVVVNLAPQVRCIHTSTVQAGCGRLLFCREDGGC
jgi:NAD(P)-dependent dehydrogenase (short-subunit alcohol dehydrogenase family)